MRVYISADIEGCTGLVSWSQCGRPNSDHYDFAFARRMMTHDVLAAVRGAKAGGAKEIVVKDSHGNSKNLLADDFVGTGVELVSGHGSGFDGMMMGIDDTFDAAMLVGYHAMAGTLHGVMEHTITGGVHRLWINGTESGEQALSAGVAGAYGVPVVMVSSDDAGVAEAAAFLPWATRASTKQGVGRYMARVKEPAATAVEIENAAKQALERRNGARVWVPDEPTRIRIEFNRAEEADYCMRGVDVARIDAYTVEVGGASYLEAHRAAWMLFALSLAGRNTGD